MCLACEAVLQNAGESFQLSDDAVLWEFGFCNTLTLLLS